MTGDQFNFPDEYMELVAQMFQAGAHCVNWNAQWLREIAGPNLKEGEWAMMFFAVYGKIGAHTTLPSILYPNGVKEYFVNGVRVPELVLRNPESITVEMIDRERNAEVRRIMLERFGFKNYVTESGLKPVSTDKCGQLFRKDDCCVVKVKNSTPEPDGSFKDYFLTVPPTIRTAREAVAWTFDIPEETYRPILET